MSGMSHSWNAPIWARAILTLEFARVAKAMWVKPVSGGPVRRDCLPDKMLPDL
jgi:hypothetical protein